MKKVTRKTVKKGTRKKQPGLAPKIIIGVVVLIVLIGLGMFIRNTLVGEAQYTYLTPPEDIVDLEVQEYVEVSVDVDPYLWGFSLESGNYEIEVISLEEEEIIYSYFVRDEGGTILAQGLLNDEIDSTGNIYLDDDKEAEIVLSLSVAGLIKVANIQYVPGDYATVVVMETETGAEVASEIIPADEGVSLSFEISSTKLPVVEVYLDGVLLEEGWTELLELETDVSKTFDFTWTPPSDQEGVYELVIHILVDEVETIKTYHLSVGGIVFASKDEDYPQFTMKSIGVGGYELSYTFRSDKKQAFSLPCGFYDPSAFPGSAAYVSSFDKSVQQWTKGIPSEFDTLKSKKGYVLALSGDPFKFTVDCTYNPGNPPDLLPELVSGWNLVGIGGENTIAAEKLESKTPAGKDIRIVYELSNDGEVEVEELQPGRAYWVKVE